MSPPVSLPSPATFPTTAPYSQHGDQQGEQRDGDTGQGVLQAAWRVTALTGAGGVLAGALALALRRGRRRQQRHRRPGRARAHPARDLAPVEKTVRAVGSLTAPTLTRLDLLLRSLAAQHAGAGTEQPRLAAVELAEDGIVLHLCAPADLAGVGDRAAAAQSTTGRHRAGDTTATGATGQWQQLDEAGQVWRAAAPAAADAVADAEVAVVLADQPAPYPLLVTVGLDRASGSVWLINLEDHAVAVSPATATTSAAGGFAPGTGPVDLARYLAAEVACQPWAGGVQADCVGLGPQIGLLNPDRVQTHPSPPETDQHDQDAPTDQDDPFGPAGIVLAAAVAMIDQASAAMTDVVTGRVVGAGDETWPARVLILAQDPTAQDPEGPGTSGLPSTVATITDLMARHTGGTGTGVVLAGVTARGGRSADPDGVWIEIAMTAAGAELRHRDVHDGQAIQLSPVGMSAEEAHGCALLLAQSEVIDDVAVPPLESRLEPGFGMAVDPAVGQASGEGATGLPLAVGAPEWTAWSDSAGGLRPEHTLPRVPIARAVGGSGPADPSGLALPAVSTGLEDGAPGDPAADSHDAGPAGDTGPAPAPEVLATAPKADPADGVGGPDSWVDPAGDPAAGVSAPGAARSVLPAADGQYEQVAATTAQDLQALAPGIPASVTEGIRAADAGLDEDVATWFAADCPWPRLALLGPVTARTRGRPVTKRKPYWTEVLAFLALRRHGATPEELAEAFSIRPAKAREYVRTVREWLGTDPRTDRPHLPNALESPAAQARGIGVYQVLDVLIDVDLFRRLRVRGQSSGPDGITDLVTALRLVQGRPFDRLRPGGWAWLADTGRLDEHMVCAVVDVAHTVTVHALQVGDVPLARWAAQTAALAAPAEEIPRLDLAAVAHAEGDPDRADQLLRDEVTDRCDGEDGAPDDLPRRTQRILDDKGWLARATPRA